MTYAEETGQQVVDGFTNVATAEAGPEVIATFSRDHRAIENRLHWPCDVTLRANHSHLRTPDKTAALPLITLLMDWPGVRNVPVQRLPEAGSCSFAWTTDFCIALAHPCRRVWYFSRRGGILTAFSQCGQNPLATKNIHKQIDVARVERR